jgi:hypothetical protein
VGVSSTQVAEMCDRIGINVWEVIDAAATKRYVPLVSLDGQHWLAYDFARGKGMTSEKIVQL